MENRSLRIVIVMVVGLMLLIVGCAVGILVASQLGNLFPVAAADEVRSTEAPPLPSPMSSPTFPTQMPPEALRDADAEELLIAGIYQRVAPSVVHVRVVQQVSEMDDSLFDIPGMPDFDHPDEFFQRGEGSGFVWDNEGHIVTNYHVVEDAASVEVTFFDGTSFTAEVIGTDPDSDLAVIAVDSPVEWLHPITLGDSDGAFVGQRVVAIGNPFGQEWTLTTGIVSALGRTMPSGTSQFSIPEMIQTDTAINPGNSGGPLLDRNGHVMGVNTLILSLTQASSGVGFAIPANVVKQVVPSLISDGYHAYAWLGIVGRDLDREAAIAMELSPDQRGALVLEVTENSPADEAGLQGSTEAVEMFGALFDIGGDVIVAAENQPLQSMDDLIVFLVEQTVPDQEITFTVLRDGEEINLDVTLGERPR
jgi:2-alkenal reductase